MVVGPAVPLQHDQQPSIPEAATLGGFLPQGLAQRFIVAWLSLVVVAAPGESHQPARPLTADRMVRTHGSHRFALGGGRQYFPDATSLRI